jgi:ssDNA-binding Zn-finger/Zn-ribbon topoisomerase 1
MKESIHELAREATKDIKDYRAKLAQEKFNKKKDYVILECPLCTHKQEQKFSDTRTVELYCNCNVNGYMYLSLKGDKYIKYGRLTPSKIW